MRSEELPLPRQIVWQGLPSLGWQASPRWPPDALALHERRAARISASARGTRNEVGTMRIVSVLLATLLLAACGGSDNLVEDETSTGSTAITSSGGHITLGANSYLWHATLDTLRFMPLHSADPFGGVIITDWYSSPNAPNERMRVTGDLLD